MPGADFDAHQEKTDANKDKNPIDALMPRIEELEAMIKEHGSHVRIEPNGDIKNNIIKLFKENDRLSAELRQAHSEIKVLREALRKYGRHVVSECLKENKYGPCSCGLEEALTTHKERMRGNS